MKVFSNFMHFMNVLSCKINPLYSTLIEVIQLADLLYILIVNSMCTLSYLWWLCLPTGDYRWVRRRQERDLLLGRSSNLWSAFDVLFLVLFKRWVGRGLVINLSMIVSPGVSWCMNVCCSERWWRECRSLARLRFLDLCGRIERKSC